MNQRRDAPAVSEPVSVGGQIGLRANIPATMSAASRAEGISSLQAGTINWWRLALTSRKKKGTALSWEWAERDQRERSLSDEKNRRWGSASSRTGTMRKLESSRLMRKVAPTPPAPF